MVFQNTETAAYLFAVRAAVFAMYGVAKLIVSAFYIQPNEFDRFNEKKHINTIHNGIPPFSEARLPPLRSGIILDLKQTYCTVAQSCQHKQLYNDFIIVIQKSK